MSEPMRFSLKHHGQLSCVGHCSEGDYVLYSDYARLKAEVERLRNLSNAFLDVCDKYAMFRNDDERMIASISSYALRAAAKEGKHTK